MEIKIQIRNVERIQAYIKTVPYGAVKTALHAIKDYFLGNDRHGLRHYEPYKYVARRRAYGQTWFSEKQRRWFWANGGPSMIGNNRTGATSNAWQFKETRNGYGITLYNKSQGAKWIWGDKTQARQPALVGHRTMSDKISTNIKGALRHAKAEVTRFLKAKKK